MNLLCVFFKNCSHLIYPPDLWTIVNYHLSATQETGQRTIGMIELITPSTAKKNYQLAHYPHFIEFCLSSEHVGKGIMGRLLPRLLEKLKQRELKR